MALEWSIACDAAAVGTDWSTVHNPLGQTVAQNATSRRRGARGLQVAGAAVSGAAAVKTPWHSALVSGQYAALGFYWKGVTYPSAGTTTFILAQNSMGQVIYAMTVSNTGAILLIGYTNAGSPIVVSGATLAVGTWAYFQVLLYAHNAAGWYELYKDGALVGRSPTAANDTRDAAPGPLFAGLVGAQTVDFQSDQYRCGDVIADVDDPIPAAAWNMIHSAGAMVA